MPQKIKYRGESNQKGRKSKQIYNAKVQQQSTGENHNLEHDDNFKNAKRAKTDSLAHPLQEIPANKVMPLPPAISTNPKRLQKDMSFTLTAPQNLEEIDFQLPPSYPTFVLQTSNENKFLQIPFETVIQDVNMDNQLVQQDPDAIEVIPSIVESVSNRGEDLEHNNDSLSNNEPEEESNEEDDVENNIHNSAATTTGNCNCGEIYDLLEKNKKDAHKQFNILNTKLDSLIEICINRSIGMVGSDLLNTDLLPPFPLQTVDDFLTFNTTLQENPQISKQFETYLLKHGGKDVDTTVRNALTRILSNDIGLKYTWSGQRGTKMSGTHFANLFTNVYVCKLPDATIDAVEKAFAVWLRRTSDRINNTKKAVEKRRTEEREQND